MFFYPLSFIFPYDCARAFDQHKNQYRHSVETSTGGGHAPSRRLLEKLHHCVCASATPGNGVRVGGRVGAKCRARSPVETAAKARKTAAAARKNPRAARKTATKARKMA